MPENKDKIKVWLPTIKGNSGTDVYTIRLAKALDNRGIANEITWFNSRYELFPVLLKYRKPPDHVNIIHANAWNAFAFKRSGIPLIATEHHNVFDPQYRPFKNYMQYIYHQVHIRHFLNSSFEKADIITTVSQYMAKSIAKTAKITSVRTIYNFVDTNVFRPLPEKTSAVNGKFKLLFVGNPTHRKGGDLLAPIMKKLGDKFELYCTSGLRNLTTQHNNKNIISVDHIDSDEALVELYNKCHALLFPTRFEGFGYVALEAMACGKPVVTTNNSALPEIVKDGETGILCPTDDISAMVSACKMLAKDEVLYNAYSHAARERATACFSEEHIISQYIALYQEAINNYSNVS